MTSTEIIYTIDKSSVQDILIHLRECNNDFIPPLSDKVDLKEYAKKLFEKSNKIEAWHNNTLIGLIAAYFNDSINKIGFITNVSLIKNFIGKGIASQLMSNCIHYAKQNNFILIQLEVNKASTAAIYLYKKFGFIEIECKGNIIIMNLKIVTQ